MNITEIYNNELCEAKKTIDDGYLLEYLEEDWEDKLTNEELPFYYWNEDLNQSDLVSDFDEDNSIDLEDYNDNKLENLSNKSSKSSIDLSELPENNKCDTVLQAIKKSMVEYGYVKDELQLEN